MKKFFLFILFLSQTAFCEIITLPDHVSYSKGQGLLPFAALQNYFDVELDVNKPDCEGRHDYLFGAMTIYRGAVDHTFRILYKYETAHVVCYLTLASKSNQYKFAGKGWDSPWVDPRPNTQVWCLSGDPGDCLIITS